MVFNKDILYQIFQSKKLHLSYPLGLPVCKIFRAYHAFSCMKIPFVHTEAGHGSRYMAIVSCLLCLLNFPNQDEWGKLPVLTSRIIYN